MEAVLVHVKSDGKQQPVPLKDGKTLIGRQEDCSIRIPSAQVSRHHCELTVGGSGMRIRDLDSSNGTFVNGQRVDDETPLHEGDVLAIGPMLFVVQIDGQPATIDPEALSQRVRTAAASAAQGKSPASTPSTADANDLSGSSFAFASNDDSSIDTDFDFDFTDDDDDDQPEL